MDNLEENLIASLMGVFSRQKEPVRYTDASAKRLADEICFCDYMGKINRYAHTRSRRGLRRVRMKYNLYPYLKARLLNV